MAWSLCKVSIAIFHGSLSAHFRLLREFFCQRGICCVLSPLSESSMPHNRIVWNILSLRLICLLWSLCVRRKAGVASLILVISAQIRHSPGIFDKGFVWPVIGWLEPLICPPSSSKLSLIWCPHVACNHLLAMWELLPTRLTQNNDPGLTGAGSNFPILCLFFIHWHSGANPRLAPGIVRGSLNYPEYPGFTLWNQLY